jgi:macrolide-specific efflux system membrane fusion protein
MQLSLSARPTTERPAELPPMVEPPDLPLPRARRRLAPVLLALALLALLTAGGVTWRQWVTGAPPPAYTTATVTRATVEDSVSALGNIQPRDYVDVGTQVSGQLRAIHVQVGDRVRAGDLLAEIDPTVYQTRVDAARAQLANLEAQLAERRARLALAQRQLQRQQNLRRADATSEEAVELAATEVEVSTAQIAALEAQIGQTESQLKGDEANLGYTRIYAPIAGTVVALEARRGQTLNASQSAPTLLRVADLAVMTVWAQVSEADIGRLRLGQEVYFSTLGNPDRRFTGTLRQIMPTPRTENNVVLYDALFDVPNPDGVLMTQMTAQVFFVVARAEDVLTVPASAVREGPNGTAIVQVVHDDGTLERRPVELGVVTRAEVEIRAGLAEGEEVVTGQAQRAGARPAARTPGFRPRLG